MPRLEAVLGSRILKQRENEDRRTKAARTEGVKYSCRPPAKGGGDLGVQLCGSAVELVAANPCSPGDQKVVRHSVHERYTKKKVTVSN